MNAKLSDVSSCAYHAIYLGPLKQLLLAGGDLIGFALPSTKYGSLKSASVAKGQRPRFLRRVLIDGVQIDRRLLLGLTTAEEGDAGYRRWHGARQRCHRSDSDLLGSRPRRATLTRRHHVGLEQRSLEIYMVI